MTRTILFVLGALLLLTTRYRPTSADSDPANICIPGTVGSIKANLVRSLIICYVYGCPDAITDKLAKNFNEFHFYDLYPEKMKGADSSASKTAEKADSDNTDDNSTTTVPPSTTVSGTSAAVEVPIHVLSKLAKLTSALEKDRNAALTACTDWMSLLNKLIVDILQVNSKCFLEPSAKYPPDLPTEGGEIDCDEMTVYMKQLQKYFGSQCEGKGKDCPEKLKTAVSWFGRAYKQMGKNCYYDAYDYLDK